MTTTTLSVSMTLYRVFKRSGTLKTPVAEGVALERARVICAEGNAGKPRAPGQLRYEFEAM